DVVHGGARGVLAVRLELDDPTVRIERGLAERHVVGARVDHARDVAAVPIENEQDVVAMGCVARPLAEPRALERMTLLGDAARRGAEQPCEDANRYRSLHDLSLDAIASVYDDTAPGRSKNAGPNRRSRGR